MPANRKINVVASPAKPTTKPATATVAPRAIAVAKAVKPGATGSSIAAKLLASVGAKPVPVPTVAVPVAAKPARGLGSLNRQLAVVAAARYPFGTLSDADSAYLALFATFAKASKAGTFTLATIRDTTARPAGISINNNAARALRLVKAGYLSGLGTDASPFAITKAGIGRAEYTSAKPRT